MPAPVALRPGAEAALADLYAVHYVRLVRLAAMLLRDRHRAEEIVQDAFVDLHQRWSRLREHDELGGYLRTSVVNRVRSEMRHRRVVERHDLGRREDLARGGDVASAEAGVLAGLERRSIMTALDRLPVRQREVLILRYYGQLSEAEIAAALGISRGAVKSHSSRGLRALRPQLEES